MAAHETEDRLTREQRLKAALHFAVGRVCEDVGRTCKVSFSREVIAAIAETAFQKCESVAVDLELFAKHAKRLTVTNDDVKMVCRNNEQLTSFLVEEEEKLKEAKESAARNKGKSKKTAPKSKDQPPVILDDDSN